MIAGEACWGAEPFRRVAGLGYGGAAKSARWNAAKPRGLSRKGQAKPGRAKPDQIGPSRTKLDLA
eukprot:9775825-Alexandrium_andersonii.AAC.1